MSVMTAAAIFSTVAGIEAANEEKRLAKEAQAKADLAADEAERERLRVQADTRPDAETATGIDFGTSKSKTGEVGGFEEFVVQDTSTSGLKTSGTSGLGFSV